MAAAPRVVLAFKQIALSAPATAAGNGLTVTTTLWVFVHPVAVIVSTIEEGVVISGVTEGLAAVEANPTGAEVQLYVLPAMAPAPRVVLAFKQIALSAPATAAGNGLTVTTTLWVFVHPVAVIVSTTE